MIMGQGSHTRELELTVSSSLVVPIIAQFCDAVKAEYSDSTVLSGISASQLQVFKNKESFDRRDAKEEKVNLQMFL